MSKTKTGAKSPKSAKKSKPVKSSETTQESGGERKGRNRVFAMQVTDEELAALHTAAGRGNASKVVRKLVAAFVAKDTDAFRAIVEDAKAAA